MKWKSFVRSDGRCIRRSGSVSLSFCGELKVGCGMGVLTVVEAPGVIIY